MINKVLCVWPATLVGRDEIEKFTKFMTDKFSGTFEYAEEFKTLPDRSHDDRIVPNTGGRNDLLFFVDEKDVSRFAIRRLQYGIRWYSDYVNNNSTIIPTAITQKYKEYE